MCLDFFVSKILSTMTCIANVLGGTDVLRKRSFFSSKQMCKQQLKSGTVSYRTIYSTIYYLLLDTKTINLTSRRTHHINMKITLLMNVI